MRSSCWLPLLVAAALFAACGDSGGTGKGDGGPDGTTPAPTATDAAPREVRVLGELPAFSLTDETGAPFGSLELSDRVWVATFVFTRCGSTCPKQTARMGGLQAEFAKDPMEKSLALVTITVDPEHDTPEVLARYAKENNANPELWHFLTGTREAIWELSKSGFKLDVKDDPGNAEMPIFHSTQMVLVDTWGRIRGYYDGLSDTEIDRLRHDLKHVLRERRRVYANPDLPEVAWVPARRAAQLAASRDLGAFHDFHLEDRLEESGITFRGRPSPDGMWRYTACHYDHGNSTSLADVDGDGRIDVYLPNQIGGNELWRNLGGGRFENVTEQSGLRLRTGVSMAATFADFDNDGDPDVFVTGIRTGNHLLENDGTGKFTDVTEEAGVVYQGHSSQALAFDYDKDGLLDLFVANVGVYTSKLDAPASRDPAESDLRYYPGLTDAFSGHVIPSRDEPSIVYRNLGGMRFEDVTARLGIDADVSWVGAAMPLDGNRDGWPDLYLLNMQGRDEYWENQEGKAFVRRTAEVFPNTPWGSMGGSLLDFDGDGDLDVYVTDMHSDMIEDLPPDRAREAEKIDASEQPESFLRTGGTSIFGNALFRNDGPGKFVEVSGETGVETFWPWGPSVGDLNADGYPDIVVPAGMGFTYRYHPNAVLLNDGGKRFRDAEYVLGLEPRRDGRVVKPWTPLDCDGAQRDLGLVWFLQLRGDVELWDAPSSRSAGIVDLDDDGDLDVLVRDWA